MTVYVLLDEGREDGSQAYIDDVRFVEDLPLHIIRAKRCLPAASILSTLPLAQGDCLHVRSLVDLGHDLSTAVETILRLTDTDVRLVVAELDGFEFRKANARHYTGLLRLFTVDGQSQAFPKAVWSVSPKPRLQ